MNKQVTEIMQKEMSRKEFLATFGFGVASLFGLGTLLRVMGHHPTQQKATIGYGSGSYGGGKKLNSL